MSALGRKWTFAEALYDIESILSNSGALTKEEIRTLRDRIGSNLERAWEIAGGTEDQLPGLWCRFHRWWRETSRQNDEHQHILQILMR